MDMFDSRIDTEWQVGRDGSPLPGYMQATKKFKQFERSKFFTENHPNNPNLRSTLSNCQSFVTNCDL
jgi:hypothetical protein